MPLPLLGEELPGCAFQRLQHHERKRQSRMKASLLIQTFSTVPTVSYPSTPPVMTCVLIIGSCHSWCSKQHQKSHVKMHIFSMKQGKEKWERLPGSVMSERRRKRLTFPFPFSHLWSPQGYKEGCVAALYLWHPVGIKQEQNLILFIYLCMRMEKS